MGEIFKAIFRLIIYAPNACFRYVAPFFYRSAWNADAVLSAVHTYAALRWAVFLPAR